jgi:hypothetical protein
MRRLADHEGGLSNTTVERAAAGSRAWSRGVLASPTGHARVWHVPVATWLDAAWLDSPSYTGPHPEVGPRLSYALIAMPPGGRLEHLVQPPNNDAWPPAAADGARRRR